MKLLFVNSCLRGEESRTLRLCRDYISKFMKRASQRGEAWELVEVDLSKEELPVQDAESEARIAELVSKAEFDNSVFRFAKPAHGGGTDYNRSTLLGFAVPCKTESLSGSMLRLRTEFLLQSRGNSAGTVPGPIKLFILPLPAVQ